MTLGKSTSLWHWKYHLIFITSWQNLQILLKRIYALLLYNIRYLWSHIKSDRELCFKKHRTKILLWNKKHHRLLIKLLPGWEYNIGFFVDKGIGRQGLYKRKVIGMPYFCAHGIKLRNGKQFKREGLTVSFEWTQCTSWQSWETGRWIKSDASSVVGSRFLSAGIWIISLFVC